MTNTIKIAYHLPTQKFIHIDNASNGLSCNCECLKCNERLEAIQGEVRTKHFRHHTNLSCEGSQESALHDLGKQILVDNSQINLPDIGTISYSSPVAEKRLEAKRPDVSATFEGEQIFFEIFVSHAVDSGKEKIFVDRKHKSVEIDLSDCRTSIFDEIKKIVIDETDKKKVFYWQDEGVVASQPKEQNNFDWFLKAAAATIVFLVLREFFLTISKPRRA